MGISAGVREESFETPMESHFEQLMFFLRLVQVSVIPMQDGKRFRVGSLQCPSLSIRKFPKLIENISKKARKEQIYTNGFSDDI